MLSSGLRTLRVLAPALLVTLAACASAGPEAEDSRLWVTDSVLAETMALDVDRSEAQQIALSDGGLDRVLIFPGTRLVTVRGERLEVLEPIEVLEGEAWILDEDATAIHELWELGRWARAAVAPALPPPPRQPVAVSRPPPVEEARVAPRQPVVVIDAGHGGKDTGAVSKSGVREKDVNLAVALHLARRLERSGVTVVLTRDHDRFVELEERAAIGNRAGADLLVSIHADAAESPTAHGYTVFVERSATSDNITAAAALRHSMGKMLVRDRGVRRADYRVLVHSDGPAVLVELGFLSNATEAADLARPVYRANLAASLAEGIHRYLGHR